VTVCTSICATETCQPQTSLSQQQEKNVACHQNVVHNTGRYDEENYRVKKKKFNWVISDQLENLEFADGIWLLSRNFIHRERKPSDF
jgi:hypothetical protein